MRSVLLLYIAALAVVSGQFFDNQHFGQPGPSFDYGDDTFDQETTPEELQSKRINILPHILTPVITRGLQQLQHGEARIQRNPNRPHLIRPLVNLFTNPSR
ncbi:hypothetical protein HDE_00684 [Halotydeus destructor]|nr:hypothetical protein HDE_00684 [Halotydeus destructor]